MTATQKIPERIRITPMEAETLLRQFPENEPETFEYVLATRLAEAEKLLKSARQITRELRLVDFPARVDAYFQKYGGNNG